MKNNSIACNTLAKVGRSLMDFRIGLTDSAERVINGDQTVSVVNTSKILLVYVLSDLGLSQDEIVQFLDKFDSTLSEKSLEDEF